MDPQPSGVQQGTHVRSLFWSCFSTRFAVFCIADLQTSPKHVILGPGNSRELFSSVCISQDTGQQSHSDFTASEFTAYMV